MTSATQFRPKLVDLLDPNINNSVAIDKNATLHVFCFLTCCIHIFKFKFIDQMLQPVSHCALNYAQDVMQLLKLQVLDKQCCQNLLTKNPKIYEENPCKCIDLMGIDS